MDSIYKTNQTNDSQFWYWMLRHERAQNNPLQLIKGYSVGQHVRFLGQQLGDASFASLLFAYTVLGYGLSV